ncbi:hypothetical protein PR202_ga01512 [Eleusine coracana subsp. coracana]|uniref:Nucleolar complex protein 2-like protein n=1 Tax=Eleusine coracana subsp. coracana TaxID=191504 RepID=A0AAV5BKC0_ELECO|nr:hypothetical protein PR202_ga00825 [Eleusine coracana subsp. coracana]GJM85719.1 hypothetical protein PR202_ga01512 [Eleusine coracana subsp. coracana]
MSDSDDYVDVPVSDDEEDEDLDDEIEEDEAEDDDGASARKKAKAKQHAEQLRRLQEKDPEFYKYLEECDKELLEFEDDEIEDDQETVGGGGGRDDEPSSERKGELKQRLKPITMEMVDSWCSGAEDGKIGSIRSILRAFRKACHYGEDQGDNSDTKFSVMSGSVLDKVMHFVLKHMDRILRELLGAPSFGGKKEAISELMITKPWKKHGNLMRIYLSNALHMITEMTDEQMIAFTIHRVRASAVFLAAFPALLRKYVKKSYQRVYDWQYIFCLELWTVSSLLLDMLEMKELRGRPDGGVGKAVNLFSVKQVDKKTVKTRAFQEACIYSVVDELGKHMAHWSYSVAFFEMSFIPLVRLRSFCKTIKADRFRREIKDLIHQIEANVEFIKSKRAGIAFLPNDRGVDVIVGSESSTFSRRLSEAQKQQDELDQDDGTIAFSKNLLAEKKKPKTVKEKNKKRVHEHDDELDVVEDLVLSSDEEEEEEEEDNDEGSDEDGSVRVEDDSDEDFVDPDSEFKKQKKAKLNRRNKRQSVNKAPSKTKRKSHPKKKAKH